MIVSILILISIFLLTVTVHEVAHGAVAFIRGDHTAKEMGRLTLNPFKHIDWFWTVLLPAMILFSTGGRFMYGMAKPVPVDFGRLHRPKLDMIWVALAGPAANVFFAQILLLLFRVTGFQIFLLGIYFNLVLAVFNSLPIPPLDGSRVVAGVLPSPLDREYLKLEPFGFFIVFALMLTGVLHRLVIPGMNFLAAFLGAPQLVLG